MKTTKTLIIGAGLSGLVLANKLSSARQVLVFDKARGVGGRLATRRTDDAKFDHGAQFYRLKEPLTDMHQRWLQRGLVRLWFTENGEQHYCAPSGMTALAKDLAQDSRVFLNERVVALKPQAESWTVTFESGRTETADEIIFTCPVPQALEILKMSAVAYPAKLDQVTYSKALVVLFEKSPVPFTFSEHGYVEPKGSIVFSIGDQRLKGISKADALTVTLNAEFSEMHFDAPETDVIQLAIAELKRQSPSFDPGQAQLKKWRYGQVQKSFGDLFTQVSKGLYLAGDGFGGASLNGAARSANALTKHVLSRTS